ncbi:hypothetical protein C5S53_08440 [Methanophagales archaeon]|nr:hypothetical protein C5S53_08440 [Methanophagales archaeon]
MKKRKTIVFAAIAMAILVTVMSMGCVEGPGGDVEDLKDMGKDLEEMEEAEQMSFDEAIAHIEAEKYETVAGFDGSIAVIEATKNVTAKAYDNLIDGLIVGKEDLESRGVDIDEIKACKQIENIKREFERTIQQIDRNAEVAELEINAVATGCSGKTESVVEEAGKHITKDFEKIKAGSCD